MAALAVHRGVVDTWLTAGPVDALVKVIASMIINDPDLNWQWIAKWQARDRW